MRFCLFPFFAPSNYFGFQKFSVVSTPFAPHTPASVFVQTYTVTFSTQFIVCVCVGRNVVLENSDLYLKFAYSKSTFLLIKQFGFVLTIFFIQISRKKTDDPFFFLFLFVLESQFTKYEPKEKEVGLFVFLTQYGSAIDSDFAD